MTDCDEWWRKAFQKESRKSESDVSLKIRRILDLQKKRSDSDNIRIGTPIHPQNIPHLFRWFLSARGFSDRWLLAENDEFPRPSMGNFIITVMWAVIITVEIWMKNLNNWSRFFYSAGFPSCCWSTEGNPQHWLQSGKITHWSQAFVIHLQTSKAQGATLFMLAFGC